MFKRISFEAVGAQVCEIFGKPCAHRRAEATLKYLGR